MFDFECVAFAGYMCPHTLGIRSMSRGIYLSVCACVCLFVNMNRVAAHVVHCIRLFTIHQAQI